MPKEALRTSRGASKPQEYERRKGYGWRWNTEDGTAGHSWAFADTIDEAVEAAAQSMEGQRMEALPQNCLGERNSEAAAPILRQRI